MAWNDGLEQGTPAFNLASSEDPVIRAIAGPGSGKSFAIKRRVSRLLESGMAPELILAITFTRTAAQDLKREIGSLGIPGAEQVHARTLHSHALKILMSEGVLAEIGRVPRMVIEHEIDPALRDIENELYSTIKIKKELLGNYLAAWATLQSENPGFVQDYRQASFENEIIGWLQTHNGIMVGEVIPLAIQYLRNNPASPEIGKYSVLLVDEYQDLNKSEQEFIRLIKGDASIVIVGDDDQSIYGFKYAHPEGIRELHQMYGDYKDVPFDMCRRCPQQVTLMASTLIAHNPNRTLGNLIPYEDNHNGIVNIIQWTDYTEELQGIPNIIAQEINNGNITLQDVLILAPRRRIGYQLRDRLLAMGLNTKSYFRESAIDKDNVKRAYSLMHLMANPSDEISLRFLLGFGTPDYRRNQYNTLKQLAGESQLSVPQLLQQVLNGITPERGIKPIVAEYRKILGDLASLKNVLLDNPQDGFYNFFIKTDQDQEDYYELLHLYLKAIVEEGTEDLTGEEEFQTWYNKLFTNIQENIVMPEPPDDNNHIRVMSLHASKGLSAKLVILTSMIDALMPFIPSATSSNEIAAKVEEQRRLFYVAITRCKASNDYPGRLIISSFLGIRGNLALQLGLIANPRAIKRVSSTRFIGNFGQTSPAPVKGETLLV